MVIWLDSIVLVYLSLTNPKSLHFICVFFERCQSKICNQIPNVDLWALAFLLFYFIFLCLFFYRYVFKRELPSYESSTLACLPDCLFVSHFLYVCVLSFCHFPYVLFAVVDVLLLFLYSVPSSFGLSGGDCTFTRLVVVNKRQSQHAAWTDTATIITKSVFVKICRPCSVSANH